MTKLRKATEEVSKITAMNDWRVASLASRVGAQCIDQLFVGFACAFALAAWFPQKTWMAKWWFTLGLLWMLVSMVSQVMSLIFYGTTPGKRALGLHLQSARPNQPIHFSQMIIRTFSWWVGVFTLGAGFSTILTRADRRGWHDFAADTMVVNRDSLSTFGSDTQRKIGTVWLTTLSMAFVVVLMTLVVAELSTLHDTEVETASLSSVSSLDDVLKNLNDGSLESQKSQLSTKIKEAKADSPDSHVFKAALALLLIKSGHFEESWKLVENEKTAKIDDSLKEVACEAEAFQGCEVHKPQQCAKATFWKNWSKGCNLKDDSPFSNGAEVLGYWWNKAHSNEKLKNLDSWNKLNETYAADLNRGLGHFVAVSLDLVLNIKSEHPGNLIEKAHALGGSENILWAWAHQTALKEYGSQWSVLVSPVDQELLSQYDLLGAHTYRNVATSEKGRHLKKADHHHALAPSAP